MSEGMHFRFCETPPDIRLCRLAERRLAELRAGLDHPAPCVVRVRAASPRAFHVRVDCELGRQRGVATAEASAATGVDALERAFDRLRRRVHGQPAPALAVCGGGQ